MNTKITTLTNVTPLDLCYPKVEAHWANENANTAASKHLVESTDFQFGTLFNPIWIPFCFKPETIQEAAVSVQPSVYNELFDRIKTTGQPTQTAETVPASIIAGPGFIDHEIQSWPSVYPTSIAEIQDENLRDEFTDLSVPGRSRNNPFRLSMSRPAYESPRVGEFVSWPPRLTRIPNSLSSSASGSNVFGPLTPHAQMMMKYGMDDQNIAPFNPFDGQVEEETENNDLDEVFIPEVFIPEPCHRGKREPFSVLHEAGYYAENDTPPMVNDNKKQTPGDWEIGVVTIPKPNGREKRVPFTVLHETISASGKERLYGKGAKGMARLRTKAPPALDMKLIEQLDLSSDEGLGYAVNDDDGHAGRGDGVGSTQGASFINNNTRKVEVAESNQVKDEWILNAPIISYVPLPPPTPVPSLPILPLTPVAALIRFYIQPPNYTEPLDTRRKMLLDLLINGPADTRSGR